MTNRDNSISAGPSPIMGAVISVLLMLSFGMICVGLYAPAITVSSFYFFTTEYSIMTGINSLFETGHPVIGYLILTVSVFFPLGKIILGLIGLAVYETSPSLTRRMVSALSALSKWSMLDVFAIALTVVVINGRLLSTADLQVGIVLFASGVLLSSFAFSRLGP